MTAIIDLLILKKTDDDIKVDLYEPEWVLIEYMDTSGTYKHGKNGLEMDISGHGMLIDALFGDGPDRYELNNVYPIVLAEYHYSKEKAFNFSSRKYRNHRYLSLRTRTMENILRVSQEKPKWCDHTLRALPLQEYLSFLEKIFNPDTFRVNRQFFPMTAFLKALNLNSSERIVVPLIGAGLRRDFELLYNICGHTGAILDPRYIVK